MKLPRGLSGKDVVKALSQAGFQISSRHGSHIYLRKEGVRRPVCVPDHPKVPVGTLSEIIKEAGLTREEFLHLL